MANAVALWGLALFAAIRWHLPSRVVAVANVLRWVAPAAVGIGMIMLDYHWVSDMIGGAAIGVLVLAVAVADGWVVPAEWIDALDPPSAAAVVRAGPGSAGPASAVPGTTMGTIIGPVRDLAGLRAAFTSPDEFWSSPLYQHLAQVVAADPSLLALAAEAQDGQRATFVFFGAVHAVLLASPDHALAEYYPSVRGASALPPGDAGPPFVAFVREHDDEIRELVRTRLVQTNHVQRAVGLRLGLAAVAEHGGSTPVHLREIGSSAGLVLRHSAYGYHLGGRSFGDPRAPVQLTTEWRSAEPAPDLDAVPVIAFTTGVDLNPLDPTSEDDRRWLEALVWPENRAQADLLHTALAVAAQFPVSVLAGDAIELCPQWAAGVPNGQPRVVFHCATRIHVPEARQPAFDDAINSAGINGPLYHIAIEGDGLVVTYPDGHVERRYRVEGHLGWARPAA